MFSVLISILYSPYCNVGLFHCCFLVVPVIYFASRELFVLRQYTTISRTEECAIDSSCHLYIFLARTSTRMDTATHMICIYSLVLVSC